MRELRVGLLGFSTWHAPLLLSLLLVGCSGVPPFTPPYSDRSRLPKKVAAPDVTMKKLTKKLSSCGVRIITIGEDYLISIPSTALFPDQSPRLMWESYGLLNNTVRFLKQFRKVAVNVTGYSSKYVSTQRERALTLARARAVADYLWSQGIDSRFIFTEGLGSDKPIMDYARPGDKSQNSRIEITFRDAII